MKVNKVQQGGPMLFVAKYNLDKLLYREKNYRQASFHHVHKIRVRYFDNLICGWMMTHKYRGSIVVLSISKGVEPNEEQKEMISGFQQGILCKY